MLRTTEQGGYNEIINNIYVWETVQNGLEEHEHLKKETVGSLETTDTEFYTQKKKWGPQLNQYHPYTNKTDNYNKDVHPNPKYGKIEDKYYRP